MVFVFRGRARGRSSTIRGRPFRGRGRGRGHFVPGGDGGHRLRDGPSSRGRGESRGRGYETRDRGYESKDREYDSWGKECDHRPRPSSRETHYEKGQSIIRREDESSYHHDRDLRDQLEQYNRPFRGRSASPPKKRPHASSTATDTDSEIRKRKTEEHKRKMHSRQSPSPLRITVGNEIYFEEHESPLSDKSLEESHERLTPLCKRLGPPVASDDKVGQIDVRRDYYDRRHGSKTEYGCRSSRDSDRYDSRSDVYDKGDYRKSSDRYEKKSGSYYKHDAGGDRISKDRFIDRDRSRHEDRRHSGSWHEDKGGRSGSWDNASSEERGWHDEHEKHYKSERSHPVVEEECYREGRRSCERDWDRDSDRDSEHRDRHVRRSCSSSPEKQSPVAAQKINYYHGKTPHSEVPDSYLKSPVNVNAGPSCSFRPLKSILKKSGITDTPTDQRQDPTDTPDMDPSSREKLDRKSDLHGLVAYDMDVDDEENFLYGEHEDGKGSSHILFPGVKKGQIADSKSLSRTLEVNLPFWAAAAPPDSALSAKLLALHEKIHGPTRGRENEWQRPGLESDSDRGLAHTTTTDNAEETKQDEDLDSTVQNILKSIGFDFELSKRMQELAKQKKEKEQKTPGDQGMSISINQTASFLGVGISNDDTNSFFDRNANKESIEMRKKPRSRENIAREFQNEESDPSRWHSLREKVEKHLKHDKRRQTFYDRISGSELSSSGNSSDDSSSFCSRLRITRSRHRSDRKHGRFPAKEKQRDISQFVDQDQSSYTKESWETSKEEWSEQRGTQEWQQEYPQQPVTSQPYYDPQCAAPEYAHYYATAQAPAPLPPYGPLPGYPPLPDLSMPPPMMFPLPGFPSFPVSIPGPFNYPPSYGSSPSEPRKDYRHPSNLTVVPIVEKKKSNTNEATKKVTKPTQSSEKKLVKVTSISKSESPKVNNEVESKKKETGKSTRIVMPLKSDQKRKSSEVKRAASEEPSKKQPKVDSKSEKPKKTPPQRQLSAREREHLRRECEERKKKLEGLEREMERLRKQQNEMMRKRRRQRDGHKDPVLAQNSKLQDEIAEQIKILRRAAEESSDVLRSIKEESATEMKKDVKATAKKSGRKPLAKEKSSKTGEKEQKKKTNYQYFDPGHHWCRSCNHMTRSVFEFLAHLQSKKHQQEGAVNGTEAGVFTKHTDPFDRPWLESALNDLDKKPAEGACQACAIKGVEFMMSVSAFYCSLCSEFSGDVTCADAHLKSDKHNDNYRMYLDRNPYYEKRMVLERTACLLEKKEDDEKQKKQEIVPDAVDKVKQETEKKKDDGPGFGKFNHKEEEKKKSVPEKKAKEEEVPKEKKKEVKNKDGNKPTEEKKEETPVEPGKIPIKLTGKTGIKPPPKKVLPPWTPVTRKIPQKKSKDDSSSKKVIKPQVEKPPSLDTFLIVGSATTEGKLPVVNMTDVDTIPLPSALQSVDKSLIDDAFSGRFPENVTKEQSEELKYLGIEMSQEQTVMPKPPPPPSQNLSLPPERSDSMATSSAKTMYNIFYTNVKAEKTDDGNVQEGEIALKEVLPEESASANNGQMVSSADASTTNTNETSPRHSSADVEGAVGSAAETCTGLPSKENNDDLCKSAVAVDIVQISGSSDGQSSHENKNNSLSQSSVDDVASMEGHMENNPEPGCTMNQPQVDNAESSSGKQASVVYVAENLNGNSNAVEGQMENNPEPGSTMNQPQVDNAESSSDKQASVVYVAENLNRNSNAVEGHMENNPEPGSTMNQPQVDNAESSSDKQASVVYVAENLNGNSNAVEGHMENNPEPGSTMNQPQVDNAESSSDKQASVVYVAENLNRNSNAVEGAMEYVCESNMPTFVVSPVPESDRPAIFHGGTVSSTTISEMVTSAVISSVAEHFTSVVQSSTDDETNIIVTSPAAQQSDNDANNSVQSFLDGSGALQSEPSGSVHHGGQDVSPRAFDERRADTTSDGKGLMPVVLYVPDTMRTSEAENTRLETDVGPDVVSCPVVHNKINADTTSTGGQFMGHMGSAGNSQIGSVIILMEDESNESSASDDTGSESKADTTSNVKQFQPSNQENVATSEVDVEVTTPETPELIVNMVVDTDTGRNAVSTSDVCIVNPQHATYVCTTAGDEDPADQRMELENTVGTSSKMTRRMVQVDKTECTEAVGISLEPQDTIEDDASDEYMVDQTQSDDESSMAADPESVYVGVDEAASSDVQSSTQTYFEDPFIGSQTDSKDMDVELSGASTCTSSTNNWTDVVNDAFAAIATLAESTSEVSIFSPNNSDNFTFAAGGSQESTMAQSSTEALLSDQAMSETFINPEAIQIEGIPLFEPTEVVHSTTQSNRDFALAEKQLVGTSSETVSSNVLVDSTEVESDESAEINISQTNEVESGVDVCDSASPSSDASEMNMGSDFEVVDECQSD